MSRLAEGIYSFDPARPRAPVFANLQRPAASCNFKCSRDNHDYTSRRVYPAFAGKAMTFGVAAMSACVVNQSAAACIEARRLSAASSLLYEL